MVIFMWGDGDIEVVTFKNLELARAYAATRVIAAGAASRGPKLITWGIK